MNLYPLLITLIIVNAEDEPDTKCDGVIIDAHYHEKEILKTGLDQPYLLDVDFNTNTIYFSYDVNDTTSKSALFDIETKEFKDINDVPNGYTQTVDHNSDNVYIGALYGGILGGIYKYDHKNHKSELYVAKGTDIWRIFFKDVIYFSEWPSQFMYSIIDGNIARFKDLEDIKIDQFVIDREDDIFYSNDTGLYAKKKGGTDSVLYSIESVHALTLDVHANAYTCTSDAIYKIDKMKMSLEKLLDVNNCIGLAFDKDNNFIYSDGNSLVLFKRIRKTC